MNPILRVENLSIEFGGIVALNQVNFQIPRNQISALIGPNGAGKTTLFNCVTGFYRPRNGKIFLHGARQTSELCGLLNPRLLSRDLGWLQSLQARFFGGSHVLNHLGVARTFQNIRLFQQMSVMENLLVAQHTKLKGNLFSGLFNTKAYVNSERTALEIARYWLDFFELSPYLNKLAAELSYGQQRRLEIARALCTRPLLLCLDEPAAGLNPQETADLSRLLQRLCAQSQLSILLIEHDMRLVMEISQHIIVLDHGEVIAIGTPAQIQQHPQVLAAYLGTEYG